MNVECQEQYGPEVNSNPYIKAGSSCRPQDQVDYTTSPVFDDKLSAAGRFEKSKILPL